MKTDNKRRSEPGISLLASCLGKHVRTIRRWIKERPGLRRVLRARRHGKQWRIDWPKDQLESKDSIAAVQRAVAHFTRSPEGRNEFVEDCLEFLGFGGEESKRKRRERDVEILRQALWLKRASRKLEELDGEEQAEDNSPSLSEWEAEADSCCQMARCVAGRFRCSVQEVPQRWTDFCREQRDENRKSNAPKENWLKVYGLQERAEQLLPEAERPGELVAFIGRALPNGKPRVKLYRFRARRKPRTGRWRRVSFRRETIQLLRVVTDEEITAEVSRVHELWPDPEQWQRAKQQYQRDWELRTLGGAALELVQEGKAVNGSNLAALLFRNPRTQDVWKAHQQHLELKRHGIDVFCDEQTFCKGAKRGVSLREFRHRYTRRDIAEATKNAEVARSVTIESARNKEAIYGTEPAEDREHEPRKTDETGVGVRDEHGAAVTDATEKDKEFVSSGTALRVRHQFEQSRQEIGALTPEERLKIEAALGRSLEHYIEKPFREDFKPA
jgi:hypothetical protein